MAVALLLEEADAFTPGRDVVAGKVHVTCFAPDPRGVGVSNTEVI